MRSTQKYPDFIEIGIDVWDNIYDWHVVHQQPVNMTRTSDGRYAMVFMFTTLLLRPDQAGTTSASRSTPTARGCSARLFSAPLRRARR